ncbi:hypothetical protein HJO_05295 [Hyphomonas johnsonii MHS-2]|uniref:Uncharacterized protein n=1 Tax=Hyphomonas johnsonii MHS-2 TaxID=1280950 RepID=A0A059FRE5_9PROT|nr:hypothetical protein HJO_05295 [Hyphomonas johnsonii MHS-2]
MHRHTVTFRDAPAPGAVCIKTVDPSQDFMTGNDRKRPDTGLGRAALVLLDIAAAHAATFDLKDGAARRWRVRHRQLAKIERPVGN